MANGYPKAPEASAMLLPECSACGSQSFREVAGGGLRCDDCGAVQADPFTLLP